jgi:hypothetical protein
VRRNLTDPTDVAFFYAYLPAGRPATLPTLVTVAGRRWPVEEDFQVGKDQFGLNHSQVRLYIALLRHLALTMIALAACAVAAATMRAHTNTLAPPPTHPDDKPPEPSPRSNAWPTWSPGPAAHSPTTCDGRGGAVATKPAAAGSTTAPGYVRSLQPPRK